MNHYIDTACDDDDDCDYDVDVDDDGDTSIYVFHQKYVQELYFFLFQIVKAFQVIWEFDRPSVGLNYS